MIKIPQLSVSLGLKSVVDTAAHLGPTFGCSLDSCYGRTPASSCKQLPPSHPLPRDYSGLPHGGLRFPAKRGGWATPLGVSLVDAASPFLPVIPAALPYVEPPWVSPRLLCSGRAYGANRAGPWARKLLLPGAVFSVRVSCQLEANVGMA